MGLTLLDYILWRQYKNSIEPTSDVSESSFSIRRNTGCLMWQHSSKYTGTTFALVDGDLIATAPTGEDVEDLEIDEDGYLIYTTA